MEISYPTIPYDEKKSVKITRQQEDEIRTLHANGLSINRLSKMYHVTRFCIKYHLDDEWKQKRIDYIVKFGMKKYYSDPIYRQRVIDTAVERHKRMKKEDPKYKKWANSHSSMNRQEKRKLLDEISRLKQLINV